MEGKAHVISFLQNCIDYANASIERKRKRGDIEDIEKWEAYRDFTAHAIMEVEADELDRWFPKQHKSFSQEDPTSIDLASLSHEMRATWLTNLASPRPLALIGTSSEDGTLNLAPYTSLSIVSNSPPLAIVSFSANRHDRWRDTLLNIRATKTAVLNFLPASARAAEIVEQTARPLEHGTSEWESFSLQGISANKLVMEDAAFALIGTMIEEIDLPEAKAKLVVLKLGEILVPGQYDAQLPAHILCQHGLDRLMATPTKWHYTIARSV